MHSKLKNFARQIVISAASRSTTWSLSYQISTSSNDVKKTHIARILKGSTAKRVSAVTQLLIVCSIFTPVIFSKRLVHVFRERLRDVDDDDDGDDGVVRARSSERETHVSSGHICEASLSILRGCITARFFTCGLKRNKRSM